MTIRQVSSIKTQPGQVTDQSSAGLELYGSASQDHQHSYDQGIKLTLTFPFWQAYGPGVFAALFGNLIIIEGWVLSEEHVGGQNSDTILTLPVELRPSVEFLPVFFRIRALRSSLGSPTVSESVKIDTDFGLKMVKTIAGDHVEEVQLNGVRYLFK